jgi:cellulose synthase/poly-beta-1,6-N-acetylglucosamine synthase-like glycosyltransferase
MAPEDIDGLFTQRLRWAMGALQILIHDNPASRPGLTPLQRLLFFDSCIYPLSAFPKLLLFMVPILYLFSNGTISPIAVRSTTLGLQFTIAIFLVSCMVEEITMWLAVQGESRMSVATELVRNMQESVGAGRLMLSDSTRL